MRKSEGSDSKLKLWTKHAAIATLCAFAVLLAIAPAATAQGTTEFTLIAAPFDPAALAPGGTSSSAITVGSVNGFSGSVALSCQVTSAQVTTSPPVCAVSPTTVTPNAGATATVTTTGTTTTVGYTITITGTGPTTTYTTPAMQLTVLAVTPQFTITVQDALAPSSVPAGSGGQATISINPINGYASPTDPSDSTKHGVYLSCASITPLVTIPPICSFTSPNPDVLGTAVTSTLTISTFGPVITGSSVRPRIFYGLWLPLPMLSLVGIGAVLGGKRSRKAWGLLALCVLSASFLLMPACGNSSTTTTTTPNGITPANTYTFTIVGVDINGVVSSNTGSTTSAGPTVSMTVTTPTTTK